ncbi:MAG: enoyl-CoA hydratase [Pseudomonadota bacterium]
MTDRILTERDGAIARIVVNQPEKRNAVTLEMWEAMEAALDRFAGDAGLRVLILAGAGGRAFVSGADISKFASERATAEGVKRYGETTTRVYAKLERFPRPTIAQIDGYCIGGGVALAVCCDIRLCAADSQFAIPAAKLGLGYGYAGIRRLVSIVGPAFAKEIFFTARRFSAEEAAAMGLVNRILPAGGVEARARAMAETIAANAPLTVDSVKAIIDAAAGDESARDLARYEALVQACFASADYEEGRRAFLEKRKPVFRGA